MPKPRILLGCERSGIVRDAFAARGWDAWSCDLEPSETPGQHIICDHVLHLLDIMADKRRQWRRMIVFPPCTYLCCSGLHWNKRVEGRQEKTEQALNFVRALLGAPIEEIALENPIGCISTQIRRPDQIIQPWQFGHPESKATCLWLKNLPLLVPTNILPLPACGRWDNQTASGQNRLGPSATRAMDRARTYTGIAQAMTSQWSNLR